jgi:hypothetical protein
MVEKAVVLTETVMIVDILVVAGLIIKCGHNVHMAVLLGVGHIARFVRTVTQAVAEVHHVKTAM